MCQCHLELIMGNLIVRCCPPPQLPPPTRYHLVRTTYQPQDELIEEETQRQRSTLNSSDESFCLSDSSEEILCLNENQKRNDSDDESLINISEGADGGISNPIFTEVDLNSDGNDNLETLFEKYNRKYPKGLQVADDVPIIDNFEDDTPILPSHWNLNLTDNVEDDDKLIDISNVQKIYGNKYNIVKSPERVYDPKLQNTEHHTKELGFIDNKIQYDSNSNNIKVHKVQIHRENIPELKYTLNNEHTRNSRQELWAQKNSPNTSLKNIEIDDIDLVGSMQDEKIRIKHDGSQSFNNIDIENMGSSTEPPDDDEEDETITESLPTRGEVYTNPLHQHLMQDAKTRKPSGSRSKGVNGSLASLLDHDSPATTSVDLEWEPEAGFINLNDPLVEDTDDNDNNSLNRTMDTASIPARSVCSTPNSLEWDFKESTLSLQDRAITPNNFAPQGSSQMDFETEQLIQEIEILATRALTDTGHGLNDPPR